jgi:DNA-binding NtrC family response regulator
MTSLGNVLIIDDEANMCHMLKTILSRGGYDITTAANGREGLEKLESARFDIVLCDLRMPEMDGLAFLDALGEAGRSMTIIMMSAYGTVDIAIEAIKSGAYDYISKPLIVLAGTLDSTADGILAVDDMVGEILGYLERTGRRENTLVVFTSDHGSEMGRTVSPLGTRNSRTSNP